MPLLQTTIPIDMAGWMSIAQNNLFAVLGQAGPYLMTILGVIVAVKLLPKLLHWLIGGN